MRFLERALSRISLGAIVPVVLLLTGWWGSFGILGDGPWIPWAAFGGLALGVLLDLTVLRRHLGSLYVLPSWAVFAVALFYSVMIYGFFMGFPVPELLVGLAWGFVVGRQRADRLAGDDRAQAALRIASRGAACIMFALCCVTAWLALRELSIASEVRGMLGLSFTPSTNALRALSLFGGLGLVALQYGAVRLGAKWASGV